MCGPGFVVGGTGKQAAGARGGILGTQKRLAEITEMIHTVGAAFEDVHMLSIDRRVSCKCTYMLRLTSSRASCLASGDCESKCVLVTWQASLFHDDVIDEAETRR